MFLSLEKSACALLFILLCTSLSAQIYRVSADSPRPYVEYEDDYRESLAGSFELSPAVLLRFARIEDPEGIPLSSLSWGGGVRGIYYFSDWFGLGADFSYLNAEMAENRVFSYIREGRAALVGKVVLSQDVEPRFYILLGGGIGNIKSEMVWVTKQTQVSYSYPVFMAGVGMDFDISESFGIGLEYMAVHSGTKTVSPMLSKTCALEEILQIRMMFRL